MAILFLFLVCTPAFGVCLCICRHCTCCIADRNCTCLRCGGSAPTQARCGTCFLGFTAAQKTGEDGMPEPTMAYPAWSRWFVRACLVLVIGAVAGLATTYQVLGNQGLTSSMRDLVLQPPSGAASLVRGLTDPVQELVIATASGPVRSLLNRTASVIGGAVNFSSMAESIGCVIDIRSVVPNTDRIRGFLANTTVALDRVDSELVGTFGAISDVIRTKDNITSAIAGLQAAVRSVDSGVRNVSATLGPTKTASADLTRNMRTLTAPSTGYIPTINAQFSTLTTNTPTATELSDTSSQVTALRGDSYAGATAGARASRTTLLTNLQTVQTKLSATGDQNATADLLAAYNTLVAEMKANLTLPRLADALGATINATNSLPATSTISAAGDRLTGATSSIDFSGFKVALTAVQAAIDAIPDFTLLISEIEGVRNVTKVYPCLDAIAAEVSALNRSLFALPDSFGFVDTVVALVKDAVDPVIASLPNTTAQIRSAEASVRSVNVTSFNGDIITLETQVQNSTGNVNISGLLAEVGEVNSASSIDGTLVGKIRQLENDLEPVDASLITSLRSFQANKAALLVVVAAQQVLIDHYDGGYCSTAGTSCKADGDCTGADTCSEIGTRRCVGAQATACGSCPAGDRCNLINTELDGLATGLDTVRTSTPDTSAASTQLSTAQSSANIDIDGLAGDIDNINASFAGLPLSSILSQLNDVSTNIDSNFDVSAVNGTIQSARLDLKAVDLSSFQSQTTTIDSTISGSLDAQMPTLRGARGFAINLDRFVSVLVPRFTRQLRRPALAATASSSGLYGLVIAVTGVLDEAIAGFSNSSVSGNATSLLPPIEANVTSSVTEFRDTIESFTDASLYASGALNYLVGVVPGEPLGKTLPLGSPLAHRAMVSSNGAKYPGGALCLTDECLEREVKALNTMPLDEALKGITGAPSLPVPVTRELAFLAPVAVPLLIVLAGLLALLLTPCLSASPRCQACPSSLFVCCTFVWAPCMLLFAILFLPLVLVFSDVCYSLPNIVYGAATSDPSALCGLAGGTGPSTACDLSFTLPIGTPQPSVSIQVDLTAVLRGALGQCPATDPIATAVTGAGNQVADALGNVTSSLVNSTIGSTFPLRDPLQRAVDSAAAEVPLALRSTVAQLASALSCGKVSGVLTSFTDPVCCSLLDSVFWLAMPWVFMPLVLACCGCTCGLMARKRLPSTPWGEEYTEAGGGAEMMHEASTGLEASFGPQLASKSGGPKLASASVAASHAEVMTTDFEVKSPVNSRRARRAQDRAPRTQPAPRASGSKQG